MATFQEIPSSEPIKAVIKAAFDADLPLDGGWGYDRDSAVIIHTLPDGTTIEQMEHMIASMRTYMEMHLTLDASERYGSINLNEKGRETLQENDRLLHKITYEASAMKEDIYASFIDEYKEGYGKEGFDLQAHFQRRKEATLLRTIVCWYDLSSVL